MTKLTGAALDRAVAQAMGLKSVNNCEKWGKEMTEEDEAFNEIERQAKQRKESVMAAVHTLTEYQRGYENGFVDGVQKQTESAVTKMMNGGIRNDTISEVLQLIKELRPAIMPLEGMGRGKATQEWFDILVKEIEEKL